MVYGNIVAARQTDIKRMLAYSGVAHAGYVLLGICAGEAGIMAVFFYMLVYMLMNIGAFGILSMAERPGVAHTTDAWRGIGQQSPFLAGALAVCMFSLAGIPPLAGFMGKYAVFIAAINANLTVVAIIGILSSVVGAYYYLRIIMRMFFGEAAGDTLNMRLTALPTLGITLIIGLIILLGIYPSLILTPVEMLMALR
jgi:NADH-quinone oxidoreductase subunit N